MRFDAGQDDIRTLWPPEGTHRTIWKGRCASEELAKTMVSKAHEELHQLQERLNDPVVVYLSTPLGDRPAKGWPDLMDFDAIRFQF